jgi:hypothetical protein
MRLYVYVARQRLGKNVTAKANTRNNRRNVGRVVFYTVRLESKGSLWVCLSSILVYTAQDVI